MLPRCDIVGIAVGYNLLQKYIKIVRKYIYLCSFSYVCSMNRFQQHLFDITDTTGRHGLWTRVYDYYMLVMIIASIVPLMFVKSYPFFAFVENVTLAAFVVDYAARWYSSPMLMRRGWKSYLLYPFTPMAIVDLLSILPGLRLLNPSLKLLRLTRLLKIARLLKITRYSRRISMFATVLRKERHVLLGVLMLAVFYIFITALIMFNIEPRINPATGNPTFPSFFDALYWATVTLTTVGYGDLCPVSEAGRLVAMVSALFGVAVIALPSGVITASYMEELREARRGDGRESDT